MDWIRTKIGLQEATPPPPAHSSAATIDPAKLLRTQRQKLGQKEEELERVTRELEIALESGNVPIQRAKLQRKRDLDAEIRQLRGKISNQANVSDTLSSAEADLQQAYILKDGAAQLEQTVRETEKLEIPDIVTAYQDNAKQAHEFGSLLSEPLFSASAQEDGEELDDELARMQQEVVIQRMTEPKRGTPIATATVATPAKKVGNKE